MIQIGQSRPQQVHKPTDLGLVETDIRTVRMTDYDNVDSFLEAVEECAVVHVVVDCESIDLLEVLVGRGFVLAAEAPPSSRNSVSLFRWGKAGDVDEFLPPIPRGGISCEEYTLTYPCCSDQKTLVRADNDEKTRMYALFPPMNDGGAWNLIASAYLGWRRGPSSTLVVRIAETGEPVGKLMVRRLVPPGVVDAGYMTFPDFRGRGIAAASLRALTNWLFRWSSVRRIELGVKPSNRASIRTAECAGYWFESRRTRRLRNADGFFDDEVSYVAVKDGRQGHR